VDGASLHQLLHPEGTGYKIRLSTCYRHGQYAVRALSHAFRLITPRSTVPVTLRNAADKAFAFLGRCFVVAIPKSYRARVGAVGGVLGSSAKTASSAKCKRAIEGVAPFRHHKASSSVRATPLTQCSGLASAPPPKDRPRLPIGRADPNLARVSGEGLMRDGVTGSASAEWNCPTVALGLESHRSWHPDGEGDSPYHPAAAILKGE
jgi:hypothetical protein